MAGLTAVGGPNREIPDLNNEMIENGQVFSTNLVPSVQKAFQERLPIDIPTVITELICSYVPNLVHPDWIITRVLNPYKIPVVLRFCVDFERDDTKDFAIWCSRIHVTSENCLSFKSYTDHIKYARNIYFATLGKNDGVYKKVFMPQKWLPYDQLDLNESQEGTFYVARPLSAKIRCLSYNIEKEDGPEECIYEDQDSGNNELRLTYDILPRSCIDRDDFQNTPKKNVLTANPLFPFKIPIFPWRKLSH